MYNQQDVTLHALLVTLFPSIPCDLFAFLLPLSPLASSFPCTRWYCYSVTSEFAWMAFSDSLFAVMCFDLRWNVRLRTALHVQMIYIYMLVSIGLQYASSLPFICSRNVLTEWMSCWDQYAVINNRGRYLYCCIRTYGKMPLRFHRARQWTYFSSMANQLTHHEINYVSWIYYNPMMDWRLKGAAPSDVNDYSDENVVFAE